MEQLLAEFIIYLKDVKKASDNTASSYKRDIMKMILFMQKKGIDRIEDITEDRLYEYTGEFEKEHLKATSVVRNFTSLRAFFGYLVEKGNISENPARDLKAPKVSKVPPKVLSVSEVDSLLDQSFPDDNQGKRDKAILELMYSTGLRSSEVVELKLSNVDMSLNCIRLDGGRVVPYGLKTKEALNDYLLNVRSTFLPDGSDEEEVFLSYLGKPMSRQGLWKLIKKYVKKAGILDDITPTTLRNSFIMHLMDNGADLNAVQEIMGFSDKTTLMRFAQKGHKTTDPYKWARIRN